MSTIENLPRFYSDFISHSDFIYYRYVHTSISTLFVPIKENLIVMPFVEGQDQLWRAEIGHVNEMMCSRKETSS